MFEICQHQCRPASNSNSKFCCQSIQCCWKWRAGSHRIWWCTSRKRESIVSFQSEGQVCGLGESTKAGAWSIEAAYCRERTWGRIGWWHGYWEDDQGVFGPPYYLIYDNKATNSVPHHLTLSGGMQFCSQPKAMMILKCLISNNSILGRRTLLSQYTSSHSCFWGEEQNSVEAYDVD